MNENFCQVCYSWYSTVHNTLVTRSTFQKSKNIFKDSTPPLPRPPTHNCLRSHHNRLLEILFRPWTTSLGSHVRYAHASCPRNTTSERSHLTMAAKKSTLDEGRNSRREEMNKWREQMLSKATRFLAFYVNLTAPYPRWLPRWKQCRVRIREKKSSRISRCDMILARKNKWTF